MRLLMTLAMLSLAGASAGFGLKKAYACSCIDFYGEKSEIVLAKLTLGPEGGAGDEIPEEFKSLAERFEKLARMSARGGNKPYLFISEAEGPESETEENSEDRFTLNFEMPRKGDAE